MYFSFFMAKEEDSLKDKIRLAQLNTKKDENSFMASIIEGNTIKSYEIKKPTEKIGRKFYIHYDPFEKLIIDEVILNNIENYLQRAFVEEIEGNVFIQNLKESNEKVNIGYFIGLNDTEPKNRVPIQFYLYEEK